MELTLNLDTNSFTLDEFIDCEYCGIITFKQNCGCRRCGSIDEPDADAWLALEVLGKFIYLLYKNSGNYTLPEILKDYAYNTSTEEFELVKSDLLDVEQMTQGQALDWLCENDKEYDWVTVVPPENWKDNVIHNLIDYGSDGIWQVSDERVALHKRIIQANDIKKMEDHK